MTSIVLLAGLVGCASQNPDAGPDPTGPSSPVEVSPIPSRTPIPPPQPLCDRPEVHAALDANDTSAIIAAFGGAKGFRRAVLWGVDCVDLHDPQRVWVVVNKQNPFVPIDFVPDDLVKPAVPNLNGHPLRAVTSAALEAMAAAAKADGVGQIGMLSGYRSYNTQVSLYQFHVRDKGQALADIRSARAGHSEHQSGLTGDLVACGSGCTSIYDFGGTPQGVWTTANAWRFGFITRYEEGRTEVTGFASEPWHMRYIGPELAALYHEGGYTTLEEFFGLPPAPTY